MKYTKEINNIDDLREKFHPWAGAETVIEDAIAKGRGEELFNLVEETFGDSTPDETEVNDFIWFDVPDMMDLYEDNKGDDDITEDEPVEGEELPESKKATKANKMEETVARGADVDDEEKPFYGVVGIKNDGTAVAVGIFTNVDEATDAGTEFVDENDAADFDIFGADTEEECNDEFTFRMFSEDDEVKD